MSTWICAVTNEGEKLLNMLVDGATLSITRVVSGGAQVPVVDLKEQTQISDIKQTLTLQQLRYNEDGTIIIPVLLENTTLEQSYFLWQVGFFATHPKKGEILFAISQISSKKEIPNFDDSPGYAIEWNFHFKNSNESVVSVNLDPAGFVTVGSVEAMIEENSDLITTEKVATVTGTPPAVEPVTLAAINAGDKKNHDEVTKLSADLGQKVDYSVLMDEIDRGKDHPFNVVVPKAGWTNAYPYTNAVTVQNILASDSYSVVGIVIPSGATESEVKALNKSIGFLMQNDTGIEDNKITFMALKKPTVDMTISIVRC